MIALFDVCFLLRLVGWGLEAERTNNFMDIHNYHESYWGVADSVTTYLIILVLFYFAYEMKILKEILQSNFRLECDFKVKRAIFERRLVMTCYFLCIVISSVFLIRTAIFHQSDLVQTQSQVDKYVAQAFLTFQRLLSMILEIYLLFLFSSQLTFFVKRKA